MILKGVIMYVFKTDFLNLLKEYKETKNRRVYDKIGTIFLAIARNLLNKHYFIQYTQDRKDEMISEATYYMCKYIDKFNLDQDNPFAYFTTTAWRAFLQYINERKKHDSMFKSLEFIEDISFENNIYIDSDLAH